VACELCIVCLCLPLVLCAALPRLLSLSVCWRWTLWNMASIRRYAPEGKT
jgi:hypothetical protein